MDCDLNIPTLPSTTEYDGGIYSIRNYLCREKPVGWVEEISKLQDLAGSYNKPGMNNWPVKFRLISPGVVLPRQVSYKYNRCFNLVIVSIYFSPDLPFYGPEHTQGKEEENLHPPEDYQVPH